MSEKWQGIPKSAGAKFGSRPRNKPLRSASDHPETCGESHQSRGPEPNNAGLQKSGHGTPTTGLRTVRDNKAFDRLLRQTLYRVGSSGRLGRSLGFWRDRFPLRRSERLKVKG